MGLRVSLVQACQRAGRGGSPTAVVDETSLSDAERRAVPVTAGTSHVAFLSTEAPGSDGRPTVSLRFFTAAAELPACGHGTVAALAVLAERAQAPEYEAVLRAGGRTFAGRASADGEQLEADFDPGPVELRDPTPPETGPVLAALGLSGSGVAGSGVAGSGLAGSGVAASGRCRVASVGRPRLLVPVPDRQSLSELAPDLAGLREACDRLGLLGCYVHSTPSSDGRTAARMFAPSIGVPEDIANANGTACLAAHLAGHGRSALRVDMGDSLGTPATITASTRPGPDGPAVRVGGTATVSADVTLA